MNKEFKNTVSTMEGKKEEYPLGTKEIPREEIDKIIRTHMYSAFGSGLIPLPLVDFAAITGIQLNLIRKLAKLYDIPFSKEKAKSISITLIRSTLSVTAGGAIASIVKAIPIVGYSLGAMTTSIIGSASTYATGHVFNRHFATGGTFLTFDTEKVKDYYAQMFSEGKEVSSNIKSVEYTSRI